MKRLFAIAMLLCSVWNIPAADSTIANLNPIATVPDTYRMPWENPGVQDFYITFNALTNQILQGIANQSFANTAAQNATNTLAVNLGITITAATNDLNTALAGKITGATNTLAINLLSTITAATNTLNAGIGATYLKLIGGTVSGAVLTTSTTTNAPSVNEFVTAEWVRSVLPSQITYYLSPTNSTVANNVGQDTPPFPTHTALSFSPIGAVTAVMTNWISPPNSPGLAFLPAGQYEWHIHADKSAGTRNVTIYAEIWEANAAGADVAKIGTTEVSPILPAGETEFRLDFVNGNVYTFAATTSRIVTRAFAVGAVGGSDATVQLWVGGTADSHTTLPGTSGSGGVGTVTLTGDATGTGAGSIAVTVTNLQQGMITNKVGWTNVVSRTNSQLQKVDMQIKEGDFETNAGFAFLGIINKSTTNYQSAVVTVYNTTASVVPITAPANVHTNGTLPYVVTNISKVLFEYHPLYLYTNMLVFPLF